MLYCLIVPTLVTIILSKSCHQTQQNDYVLLFTAGFLSKKPLKSKLKKKSVKKRNKKKKSLKILGNDQNMPSQ